MCNICNSVFQLGHFLIRVCLCTHFDCYSHKIGHICTMAPQECLILIHISDSSPSAELLVPQDTTCLEEDSSSSLFCCCYCFVVIKMSQSCGSCEAHSYLSRHVSGSLRAHCSGGGDENTLVESHRLRSVNVSSKRLHPRTEQVKGMTCELRDEPLNTSSPQLYSCVFLSSLTHWREGLEKKTNRRV